MGEFIYTNGKIEKCRFLRDERTRLEELSPDEVIAKFGRGKKEYSNGTYYGADGSKYVGEWKDDKMDGQGVFAWADGSHYEGECKNGLKDGSGSFYFANGDIYTGLWENDEIYGDGIYTYSNGITEECYYERDR